MRFPGGESASEPPLYEARQNHPELSPSELIQVAEFYLTTSQDEDFHPEFHALLTDENTHRSPNLLRELKTLIDTFPIEELVTTEARDSFTSDLVVICGRHSPT